MNSIGSPGQVPEAFNVVPTSQSITLGSTGVTDLLNVSEIGYLASIAWVDNQTGTWAIEITVDGQTMVSIPIAITGTRQPIANAYMSVSAGAILLPFGTLRYASSLRVSVNVTATGTGSVVIAMIRGKKI